MFLIKLFFFIIFLGILAVVVTVLRVAWSVRKMQQKLRRGAADQPSAGRTTTSQGDILTDTRDPQRAGRKIIDDDEGEYVDFVEEK